METTIGPSEISYPEDGFVEKNGFRPETTINNTLGIIDKESYRNFYTEDAEVELVQWLRGSYYIQFRNVAGDQYLLATQHEGSVLYEFGKLEFGYVRDNPELDDVTFYPTRFESFFTDSNIRLGSTLEDVQRLKGDGTVLRSTGDEIVLSWVIKDPESTFLRYHHIPSYELEITFRDGKVKHVIFGYDRP